MKLGMLRSKLARKILAFFVLAALLPLFISTYIAYQHVSKIIEEESLHNLQSASKEYGLSIFFRLKLARDTLALNSDALLNANINPVIVNNLDNYFSAIGFFSSENSLTSLYGDIPSKLIDLISNSGQSLYTVQRTPHKYDVYIRVSGNLIGKLNYNYLWNTSALSSANAYCVANYEFSPVYCQDQAIIENLSALKSIPIKKDQRKLRNNKNGKDVTTTYWSLFLDHEFGVNNWQIIASEESSITERHLNQYKKIYFPFLLLSLFFVILVSSILIRKNLDAIGEITKATKEFVKGNFNYRVNIPANDELADLGKSFNLMSSSMSSIIKDYKAFSDIDKLILASEDSHEIIGNILTHSSTILGSQNAFLFNSAENNFDFHSFYEIGFNIRDTQKNSEYKRIYAYLEDSHITQSVFFESNDNLNSSFKRILSDKFDSSNASFCVIPIKNTIDKASYIISIIEKSSLSNITLRKADVFAGRISIAFEAIRREKDLYNKANHDILTQLPNKNKIEITYEKSKNNSKKASALLFIDLDNFKQINDNYGHGLGDELLKKVAKTLTSYKEDADVVARIGGDEFLFLLHATDNKKLKKKINQLCKKIIDELKKPFNIENHLLHIGSSIGAFIFDDINNSFEDVIRYADIAMYFSKKKGGDQFSIYHKEMSDELLKRSFLERDLRLALQAEDIEVHFQAKFFATTQTISGFESLLRWDHPMYGAIPPFITIEIAEDIGLIDELGQLIIKKSIAQLNQWLESGYQVNNVAINASPLQLVSAGFSEFIDKTIEQFPHVEASMIEIEITESLMLQGKDISVNSLNKLKAIGAKIAIDDFGTGYSSLSYLLELPADTLKIDRAFVIKIEQDSNATALLSAIIKLGKSMGYKIIAEGVETKQQLDFLVECGVDEIQGYYFSKPLHAIVVEERFLKKTKFN